MLVCQQVLLAVVGILHLSLMPRTCLNRAVVKPCVSLSDPSSPAGECAFDFINTFLHLQVFERAASCAAEQDSNGS